MRKFSKNEKRACDHRVWLLEWLHAPPIDLTGPTNLKIRWARLENRKFWGLQSRPTLRSNLVGELAVIWETRLGGRKLVFCFSKIYSLKNTANQVTGRFGLSITYDPKVETLCKFPGPISRYLVGHGLVKPGFTKLFKFKWSFKRALSNRFI